MSKESSVGKATPTFGERSNAEEPERRPEVNNVLVMKYHVFLNELQPLTAIIYHPSNATDVSPSVAFPSSRVIYAEIDTQAVKALRKAGYESHYGSASGVLLGDPEMPVYTPDTPVNVLILLTHKSPQILPATPLLKEVTHL